MNLRHSLYFGATLCALAGLGLLLATPIVATDGHLPVNAMTFWWSRLHPQSYATAAIEGAEYFVIPAPSRECVEPESPYAAWQTLADLGSADSIFRRLFQMATPAGRLYAALGLASVGDPTLSKSLQGFAADTSIVRVVIWHEMEYQLGEARIDSLASRQALYGWLSTLRRLTHTRCAA